MKLKSLIVLGALLLVLFVSVGITTAHENTTAGVELNAEVNSNDNTQDIALAIETTSDDVYGDEKVVIIDITDYNGYSGDKKVLDYEEQFISCKVKDGADYIDDAYVCMYDENGNEYEVWWDEENGYYWVEDKLPVGNHEITICLEDSYYTADPLVNSVVVEKAYFAGDVFCKAYYGTTSDTLTMKATVKDSYGYREDGTVTFKVNGKSYTVKTKNGVATKTVKIKKAGTYTYSAIFKSGNYLDKGVGKAKLYVYSTSKKARTFNVKGYKIVVPLSKYKKLVTAKNTNKPVFYEIKTNKFIKQTYRYYYNGNNYVYKTVKARGIICISFGGKQGLQTAPPNKYSLFLFTRYQFPDSFCTPRISGQKISSEINKLSKAKTR